jgi:tRNA-dihydrouridine synthase
MLGRPALRNPWIFRQLSELLAAREPYRPSGADVAQHLQRLARSLLERMREPEHTPLGRLKEQLAYLCRAIPNSVAMQRGLLRQPTVSLFLEAAEEALSGLQPDVLDLGAKRNAELD